VRRAFELDAARDDVPPTAGGTVFGLELVIFDGTTLDLFSSPELAAEFGVPAGRRRPKLRLVALLQGGTMRWKAAAIRGYHDGENALAHQLEGALCRVSSASPTAASSPWTAGPASLRPTPI
jgi:hypothetical protein